MLLFTKELPDWLNWIIDVAAAGFGLKNKFSVLEEKKKKKTGENQTEENLSKAKKAFYFVPKKNVGNGDAAIKDLQLFSFFVEWTRLNFYSRIAEKNTKASISFD